MLSPSAEFEVLTSMIESSITTAAPLPDQISLELHVASGSAPFRTILPPRELFEFGKYLFDRGGYVLTHRRDHPACDTCSEVVLTRLFG